VARVAQISRQALYPVPTPRRPTQRRAPADRVDAAIVEGALANQTDGYRMVTAFVRRRLGRPVNRKRVLRVMRERKLIQRRRPLERRKRPGFFRVERPRQLWQLDMTSVWVAEHGWTYLNAIIDCCTREIVAWQLELRCRADEAIAVVDQAVAAHAIEPGELTLDSDNGSAFTARRFRGRLGELGIRHRRGGYRDPDGQAFIKSWFGKLKQRELWLNEYETLEPGSAPTSTATTAVPTRARLPHPRRGPTELGGSPTTTENRGLTCQLGRGAGQSRRALDFHPYQPMYSTTASSSCDRERQRGLGSVRC
jgi:putative transposase